VSGQVFVMTLVSVVQVPLYMRIYIHYQRITLTIRLKIFSKFVDT